MNRPWNTLPPLCPGRTNLELLATLRNFAIAGQVMTIAACQALLKIPLPVATMAAGVAALLALNLWTWRRLRRPDAVTDHELLLQLLADVAALAWLLMLSGGHANPFADMFVLPLAVGAAALPWRRTAMLALATVAAYTLASTAHLPLTDAQGAPLPRELLEAGEWVNYVITAGLLAYFVARIAAALRAHERQLAQAREKELNNERIVGIGALAAGAAHELGSPLATLGMLVKELQQDHPQDAGLQANLELMAGRVAACKETLSHLMAAAGHARVQCGGAMAIDRFLGEIVDKYRLIRPGVKLRCRWEGVEPAPEILTEATLQQAILNLLNNAADASPEHVEIEAGWSTDELLIRVRDRGAGFAPEVVEKAGRQFVTTKPEGQGNGLGLFLTHATVRRFGGAVRLFNQPGGGACTEIQLPLKALRIAG